MQSTAVRICFAASFVALCLGASCPADSKSCTSDSDCCDGSVCTPATWESPETSLCLPKPPVCYDEGVRCAGAPGQEYVPYAECCDAAVECAQDFGLGYGKFCASTPTRKQLVFALLKSIETGDQAPAAIINATHYVQHNLDAADGLAGFAETLTNLNGTGRVDTARIFVDGDFVFSHTDYNFFGPKIGIDVVRFENGLIVEHWDNLQTTATEPNPSGRTMIDGPTVPTDFDLTDVNKALVQDFVKDILVDGDFSKISEYIGETYIQHNPDTADGLDGLSAVLAKFAAEGIVLEYETIHKVLGEGDFVLLISEGRYGPDGGAHSAFYDLFRVEGGLIVEHWDVIQEIPPRDEWKNDNGKFGF